MLGEKYTEILKSFEIPYYNFAVSRYPNIQSYLKIGGEWISRKEFQEKYKNKKDIDRIQPITVKFEFTDEDGKRKEITREEIEHDFKIACEEFFKNY